MDLNAIPIAAVERVEVLKDGASAVYGSDAIAGIVNFITRAQYQGAEALAYGGVTAAGCRSPSRSRSGTAPARSASETSVADRTRDCAG